MLFFWTPSGWYIAIVLASAWEQPIRHIRILFFSNLVSCSPFSNAQVYCNYSIVHCCLIFVSLPNNYYIFKTLWKPLLSLLGYWWLVCWGSWPCQSIESVKSCQWSYCPSQVGLTSWCQKLWIWSWLLLRLQYYHIYCGLGWEQLWVIW